MKKEEKIIPGDQMKEPKAEKFTKSQWEDTLEKKNTIKDYDRAWEDDRL